MPGAARAHVARALLCGPRMEPARDVEPSSESMSPSARIRAQAALVRALADEITRYVASDPRAAALREQIEEERTRLERLESRT